MKYYIQRGLNEYGPYTLADLQRYVASGNILLTDLTRNEAMQEWVPVSQVIGNIPLAPPAPMQAPANPYGSSPASSVIYGTSQPGSSGPIAGTTPSGTPATGASGQNVAAQGASPTIPTYGATTPASGSQATPGGTPYGSVAATPATPSYSGANIPAGGTVYGDPGSPGTATYAGQGGYGARPTGALPGGLVPPDMHWALVLLINFFCNIFGLVWKFIQASYVKKIVPGDSSTMFYVAAVGCHVLAIIVYFFGIVASIAGSGGRQPEAPVGAIMFMFLLLLAAVAMYVIGNFKMRESLLDYYNRVEPINLRLSGVMTFFFAKYYFQHHFSRIAAWKKTGYLAPQG